MENIKNFFKDNWLTIILVIAIIVLLVFGVRSCQNAKNEKNISDANIVALTDSIKYYKGENSKLCAEKCLLQGDMQTLELAYSKLSKNLSDMQVENANMAVQLELAVNNIQHDTCWKVVDNQAQENFNFDNMPWRKLSGKVSLKNDNLTMSVDTDKVFLDMTVAIEDNKVKVSSNNPYVEYNDAYGITIPEYEPKWCLVIGPSVNLGYGWGTNFNGGNCPGGLVASVGVSLTFGWNIVGVGKRAKKVK